MAVSCCRTSTRQLESLQPSWQLSHLKVVLGPALPASMEACNVPMNLSLEEELEIGVGVESQFWHEHTTKLRKAEVESLKSKLREVKVANHEQESVNVVHEEKVRQLKENFARFNSFWDHLRTQGTQPPLQ